jgi:Tol biopolymer transport system component
MTLDSLPRAMLIACAFVLCIAGAAAAHEATHFADYKLPGTEPVVFAPDLVSTDAYEFGITFMPDMSEFYFTRRADPGPNRILVARVTDGAIGKPKPASLGGAAGLFEPCITPDGKTIYFGQGMQIMACTREGDAWSRPVALPDEVNRDGAMALWADAEGSLYFYRDRGLFVVRPEAGGYSEARPLDPQFIPPAGDAAHGVLAPDGGYVIFDAQGRDGGKGRADLYVSFHGDDGSWSAPRNMERLNTAVTEMCPSVSPDGRLLFFCRDGDILWVDAAIIEEYR